MSGIFEELNFNLDAIPAPDTSAAKRFASEWLRGDAR